MGCSGGQLRVAGGPAVLPAAYRLVGATSVSESPSLGQSSSVCPSKPQRFQELNLKPLRHELSQRCANRKPLLPSREGAGRRPTLPECSHQPAICHVVPHGLQQGAAWLRNWGPCSPNRVQASLGMLPGIKIGQGSLARCSPWGCKESDTTEPQALLQSLL